MKNERDLKKILENHPKLVTRRQFVGLGLAQAASLTFLPSLFTSLGARGEDLICPSSVSDYMPFLLFDCVGGAGLAGNWVVGKQGGPEDFLVSYDTMGVPKTPQSGEKIDKQFGAPFYLSLSKVREGIVNNAKPSTLANLRMGVFCSATQDDTPNNLLSPAILIAKAGLRGKHITNGVGTRFSADGGHSESPISDSSVKPLYVKGLNDVVEAVSFGATLNAMKPSQREKLAKTMTKLSEGQVTKFKGMRLADQFRQLALCGYLKNETYSTPPEGLDPRQDSNSATVFGLNPTSDPNQLGIPTIVHNVINGNTGPGIITIENCDYHDGTQNTGDNKDLEIGSHIGRSVELAARLGKPLFFAVVTDGSTYSDKGTRVWRGDSGSKSIGVVGYFDPKAAPEMRRTQVGYFTDGQGVDRGTYIGNDPKKMAFAMFANYMQANKRMGKFTEMVSDSDFAKGEIDNHLVFA